MMGPAAIATKLNQMHIPPQNGDAWVPASIRRILRNPTYTGKVCWERRKVVKKMAGGQLVKSRPDAKEYLLSVGDGWCAGRFPRAQMPSCAPSADVQQ